MTNKLFFAVATALIATTALVQGANADVVSTTGFTNSAATPSSGVSSASSAAVGSGSNPTAGSASVSTAGKGYAAAETISGAKAGDVAIVGAASSQAVSNCCGSTAGAGALIGGIGSGTVGAVTSVLTEKKFAGASSEYGGTLVSPIKVHGYYYGH